MAGAWKNPFMISFSKKPVQYINRQTQIDRILQTFTEEPITDQLFIIMGVRGSGKTVLLSDLANQFETRNEWLVIRCAPTGNILHSIAEGLTGLSGRGKISVDATVGIPQIINIGVHQKTYEESDRMITDRFLEECRRKGKRLLVTIDEVTNTPQMRDFASEFQIWIGKNWPVFFLGTGLYEKIMDLQNVDNMTFLYRAPKIYLGPLDMAAIARSYQKTLPVNPKESREMSKLTRGYSFAFQALGYVYWNAMPVNHLDDILPDYDALLADAAYSKMWSGLSKGDQNVCQAIAACESNQVKDIREEAGLDSNQFNQYRIRLRNQGILNTQEYGRVSFNLPRFDVFIKENAFLYG